MKPEKTSTPLLLVLQQLENGARRQEFATLAGTTTNYLYQLGSCKRDSCSARKAKGIADASVAMSKKYGCDALTIDAIATMCPL